MGVKFVVPLDHIPGYQVGYSQDGEQAKDWSRFRYQSFFFFFLASRLYLPAGVVRTKFPNQPKPVCVIILRSDCSVPCANDAFIKLLRIILILPKNMVFEKWEVGDVVS